MHAAFVECFGDKASVVDRSTASEDFSDIPTALGIPYRYWMIGGIDPSSYAAAEKAGRVSQDIPVNHSANFAPVIQPTLETGTKALVAGGVGLALNVRSRLAQEAPGPDTWHPSRSPNTTEDEAV